MRTTRPILLCLCFLLGSQTLAGSATRRSGAAALQTSKTLAKPVRGRDVRRRNTPSCGTSDGAGGITTGGYANIADASESGVFVGQDNAVCDLQTAILGGANNTIDSGGGASGTGAELSVIGGGDGNSITSGDDSIIGAGTGNYVAAAESFIGAGSNDLATGEFSFVGSGENSSVTGDYDSVDAGFHNSVTGTESGIASGNGNAITGNGSFIGAGGSLYGGQTGDDPEDPSDQIAGADSFIGAGDENTLAANESFIGSGLLNVVESGATYATILGGTRNRVTSEYASILGGYGNVASGAYAIVAGGDADTAAGIVSFAAGYHADAAHSGSFVWSDYSSGSKTIKDTAVNQFVVRASGGTYVYSNEGATSGVRLAAGSGSWANLSDRNAKTNVLTLDDASVLAKVAALPVSTWSYTSESGVRHIGPMAQDFYAAFGVGEDDRHITSIDEDGVALAAIKALHAENARVREENAGLRRANVLVQSRVALLEAQNAAIDKRLDALEARTITSRR